jgi:CheY-like chemotaxis protein
VTEAEVKTVLVVDDEFAIVEALSELLTWEGYTVRSAGNGRAALEILASERVDVVLMDVMMPTMGGVDAARAIKADPRLRDIPIVLMTAGPLPDADVRWFTTLRKPFDVNALLSAVQRAIEATRPVASGP